MEPDRDLLFAVITLQSGFIDFSQFLEARAYQKSRQDLSLTEILTGHGWLSDVDRSHLEYLLERQLTKHSSSIKSAVDTSFKDTDESRPERLETNISETQAFTPSVDERYELSRIHAVGGIGRIWLAHDRWLGRTIALKQLKQDRAQDRVLRDRFFREARITGQLEHPGIVPVYDLVHLTAKKDPFYTMRFLKGRTMAKASQEFHEHRAEKAMDTTKLLTLLNAFVTVCNTLAYAHDKGVVHRDLKGQNILLGDFGEVVVLDWGLAKVEADESHDTLHAHKDVCAVEDLNLTVDGVALGTPAFMSPEQASGHSSESDHRADIYGLGAVLYQILTGTVPFSGADVSEVIYKVCHEEPVSPHYHWPEVPSELHAACRKAMAKDPADRYASASELAHDVQGWQESQRKRMEQALQESEAFYETLVNRLPQCILRKDVGGRFTFANAGATRYMNCSLDDIIGKTDFDLCPADLAEKYRSDDLYVMESGKPLETVEELQVGDGPKTYVQIVKTPVYDHQGRPIGTQVIFWDVTERKELEEKLRQMTRQLTELQEKVKKQDSGST